MRQIGAIMRRGGALELSSEDRRRRLVGYAIGAVLLSLSVLGLLVLLGGGGGFEVRLGAWPVLRAVIPMLGVAAATPWAVCVWWTHDEIAALRTQLPELVTGRKGAVESAQSLQVVDMAEAQHPPPLPGEPLQRLGDTWRTTEQATGALAAIVATGVLATGALRLAIDADHERCTKARCGSLPDVPSDQDVLVYGLFFAVVVATVVVPLLLAHRRCATEFVDLVFPPRERLETSDQAATLASLVHLDSGPLQSPWAILGILTPVLIGALAVYVPGLGGG
jgi:hypothetical protein